MNKVKIGLLALFMASFVACTNSETKESATDEHMHEHGEMDNAEMADAKYACPMACEGDKTYDEAGKCPVCNMDLTQASMEGHVCPDDCDPAVCTAEECNCEECPVHTEEHAGHHAEV